MNTWVTISRNVNGELEAKGWTDKEEAMKSGYVNGNLIKVEMNPPSKKEEE